MFLRTLFSLASVIELSTGIPETSGLTWRTTPENGQELVAVADNTRTIRLGRFEAGELKWRSESLKNHFRTEQSQWEAVASDSQGNLCFLEERPGAIDCISADLKTKLAHIKLSYPANKPFAKKWKDEPNSRGEGFIFLKNGHALVLKEKEPTLLIEFGPAGKKALGYAPGDALAETFPFKGDLTYVPLKIWEFGENSSEVAEDASELAVGPEGRLYILSDLSAVVGYLERSIPPHSDRFRLSDWREIPEIEKPEGLAIGWGKDKDRLVIGRDEEKGTKNLYVTQGFEANAKD